MHFNIHIYSKQIAQQLKASTCSQPFTPEFNLYKVFDKIYLMTFSHHNQKIIKK